jgi:hypothetical protein
MFRFLASTPEREGEIRWAALQTYADGKVARWIGDPESENPASVTTISAGAPRENAGGESDAGGGTAEPVAPATPTPEDGGGPDWVARGLGLAALVAGLAALVLRRRPSTARGPA